MEGTRNAIIALLLLLASGINLAGCNVVRVTLNVPISPSDVSFIVPGTTSLSDVVDKLGTPDTLGESTTGTVATYRFLDLKYSRVNFGWLVKPWSPVDPDLIMSRTGLGTDAFQVFYDSGGIVVQHSFLRHVTSPGFNPYPF